ncbi:MarR family transcriptional regulator [Neorhizobium sp. T786]|uniref:MarR family winged helix-turn-helix transcriptional regulator n=1 Tax=Pseudorhizobium xiangyangii TaxID=2883104 RepID=UPI001D000E85|nr:MarR family transcriptional regulator [Neorhizobium xiangyangii]MCB5202445.1 MarR family transcriptional regulator [Neorhizobium xiangyangii]
MNKDALTSEFLEALTNASRKIRTAFNQRVTAHGLTYPRARALLRLSKKPGMTQSELACELELEQATMVRILDRMEEHGLVERQPDPKDRRAKLIVLTPRGTEQAALVTSIGHSMRLEIFADINSEDIAAGIQLLNKLGERAMLMEDLRDLT